MNTTPVRGSLFLNGDAGENADRPDRYEDSIQDWKNAADEEGLRTLALNEEMGHLEKYARFIQGKHWPQTRPEYKSHFTLNLVGKARTESLARITDAQPTIAVFSNAVRDGENDSPYKQHADLIHNVIQAEWTSIRAPLMTYYVADTAYAAGTAFWKIGAWAPGYSKLVPLGPESVLPIQPGLHLQDSTAVIYSTYKPLSWVQRKFKERAMGLEQYAMDPWQMSGLNREPRYMRPAHIPDTIWNGLNPGMQRVLGRNPGADAQIAGSSHYFKVVPWCEYYVDDPSINESKHPVVVRDPYLRKEEHNWHYVVKPGQRLYPYKRLITFAGRRVIYDGPNPYWHGLYPFAMLRFNPVFYQFWGLSRYRDQIPLNKSINEIVAGVLDLIKQALNRQVIAREGAVPAAVWDSFFSDVPGAKMRLPGNANPVQDVRYMDPPAIPSYVINILSALMPQFDKMTGQIDMAQLWQKEQLPGGDTIERMRDSQDSLTRLDDKMFGWFLEDSGVQAVSNVIQFYTLRRRMQMFGADGMTMTDFDFDPETLVPKDLSQEERHEFWRNFGLHVSSDSMHSSAHDRDRQTTISLTAMGLWPIEDLYRKLKVPDPNAMLERLAKQYERGITPGSRSPRQTRGQRNGAAA